MSDQQRLDEVIALLNQVISSHSSFERDHSEEHEYLRQLIEEHKERKQFWLSLSQKVASGTAWTVIVSLCSAVIFTVKSTLSGG